RALQLPTRGAPAGLEGTPPRAAEPPSRLPAETAAEPPCQPESCEPESEGEEAERHLRRRRHAGERQQEPAPRHGCDTERQAELLQAFDTRRDRHPRFVVPEPVTSEPRQPERRAPGRRDAGGQLKYTGGGHHGDV